MEKRTNLWTVMLSGGDGERLRSFVQRLFGRDRAKQYCTFIGNRTMFEQTADRARMLAPAQHSVAVVAKSHVERGWVGREQMPEGKLLAQPCNRDTGPGVLLPLAYVRKKDPDASVVILPCDHFVYPEYLFTRRVSNAIEAAEAFPERVVLLGASPEKADADLGWIDLGGSLSSSFDSDIYRVSRFVEKPPAEQAARIMRTGGLLNTLVIACRVDSLWILGRSLFPQTIALLEQAANAFDTDREDEALHRAYREVPSWNLSKDLLGRCAENLAVMELDNVQWSDWGKPERILDSIGRMSPANDQIWNTELLNLSGVGAKPLKWKGAAPIEEANYVTH
jgi:mannose-1-phosphate guanylyltransferase